MGEEGGALGSEPMSRTEVAALTGAGNTQPGGFAQRTSRPPTPAYPSRYPSSFALPSMMCSGGSSHADVSEEENPIGRNTLKLRAQAITSSQHQPPPSRTQQKPGAPSEVAWQLTDDMMAQPWGTVLRALQPRTSAAMNGASRVAPRRAS